MSQRENYGRYATPPTSEELSRFFHISDDDHALIARRRGDHNKLGFAVQLGTVRFLGTFLADPLEVPPSVLQIIAKQLGIAEQSGLQNYRVGEQRWGHATEIRIHYGYRDITDLDVGFRISRWLYALCWTGTDRPSVLFDRAKSWLLMSKVLLPGVSVLERLVARVRSHVEIRLWRLLGRGITAEQQQGLENLLAIPEGSRGSYIDRLRSGPVRVSAPALVEALFRLQEIRNLGIVFKTTTHIPPSRLASLARFATTAKVTAILRLPPMRRLATLVAFIHCLEASAHDDAIEVLEMFLKNLFNRALSEDKKKRLRTLKDLDQAATLLAEACQVLLDAELPDGELRQKVFAQIPRETLEQALKSVGNLVRPQSDVYFQELETRYRSVRHFLPTLLKYIHFEASQTGQPVVAAFNWLRTNTTYRKKANDAPRDVIKKSWQRHVIREDDSLDYRAYTFCVLDELHTALRRRDVFITPSWRYSDPRAGLLAGEEWQAARPIICRTLGYSIDPESQTS